MHVSPGPLHPLQQQPQYQPGKDRPGQSGGKHPLYGSLHLRGDHDSVKSLLGHMPPRPRADPMENSWLNLQSGSWHACLTRRRAVLTPDTRQRFHPRALYFRPVINPGGASCIQVT